MEEDSDAQEDSNVEEEIKEDAEGKQDKKEEFMTIRLVVTHAYLQSSPIPEDITTEQKDILRRSLLFKVEKDKKVEEAGDKIAASRYALEDKFVRFCVAVRKHKVHTKPTDKPEELVFKELASETQFGLTNFKPLVFDFPNITSDDAKNCYFTIQIWGVFQEIGGKYHRWLICEGDSRYKKKKMKRKRRMRRKRRREKRRREKRKSRSLNRKKRMIKVKVVRKSRTQNRKPRTPRKPRMNCGRHLRTWKVPQLRRAI